MMTDDKIMCIEVENMKQFADASYIGIEKPHIPNKISHIRYHVGPTHASFLS